MRSGFKKSTQFNTNVAALAAAFFGSSTPPMGPDLRAEGNPFTSKYAPSESRYYPHQGLKECARRRAQMAKIAAK